jgi:hypothetical protein
MLAEEALLSVVHAAWEMPSSDWSTHGPVVKLRHLIVDHEGLEGLVAALRDYSPPSAPPPEVVAEIWSLPFHVAAWAKLVEQDAGPQPRLRSIERDIQAELNRLLGTPLHVRT